MRALSWLRRSRAGGPALRASAPRRSLTRPLPAPQGCWAELLEGIGRAADLRSICGAHSAYLAAIVEGGLFLDVEAFTEPVRAITEVAFQFAALQTRLHDGLLEADAQRRARREREARNTAAGRWASIGGGSRELRPISEAFEAEVEVRSRARARCAAAAGAGARPFASSQDARAHRGAPRPAPPRPRRRARRSCG